VVAPHYLATAAGLHVLRSGGNAIDAAIATNAVLGVVMPNACGIGGDAFWLIWDAAEGRQVALNGSGRAPAGVDAAALRHRGLERIPLRGALAVTIPGAVRSWGDAHRRYGRASRAEILGPAIELARGGFPAWDGFIDAVERVAPDVAAALGPTAGFFDVYRPGGRAWRPGELVRLPALAATLERLAADGFDTFYDGELGARQAAALSALGLSCLPSDFEAHTSTWTEPIATTYRGVRVTTHPPNSSGIVALELLNILETFDAPAAAAFGPDGVRDAAWIHLAIEAAKLAMADRDATLTDPEARDVPVEALLDKARAGRLAAGIDRHRSSRPLAATNPTGGGTIYLAVVDAAGNAVSLIESNYMGFGSGVVDPDTGIHYQNRGSYFSLDPEHPNVLEPAKRTLHTLLPGMLFRDAAPGTQGAGSYAGGAGRAAAGGAGAGRPDAPWVVAGAMGGDAQPQVHAQLVSGLVDGGLDLRTAVSVPRWFVEPGEHFEPPVEVRAEPRFAAGVLEALEAMGHPVTRTAPFDGWLGHEHGIELVDGGPAAEGGSVVAATDPRSAGLPAVW
jgi:gamma-glutamyltranspeptidase/glutathione hydrolase